MLPPRRPRSVEPPWENRESGPPLFAHCSGAGQRIAGLCRKLAEFSGCSAGHAALLVRTSGLVSGPDDMSCGGDVDIDLLRDGEQ